MGVFRLKNFLLLSACLLYFLFRNKADKKVDPKKVIVFPSGKLGDVVCTTPVFRSLKNKNVTVFMASNDSINEAVLKDANLVDFYINTKKILPAILEIKKNKIDAAVITGPTFLFVAIAFLSGIPLVVAPVVKGGYSSQANTKPYKLITKLIKTEPHFMGKYAPRERLRLLEPLGIFENDTTKQLGFSNVARDVISEFYKSSGIEDGDFIVGISPSAGNKIKNWSGKKFAQVADYLYQKYKAHIIIIGSKRDVGEVNAMLQYLSSHTKYINTTEKYNIDELKALISKMSLFISVDTGPIYIAEAFGVATIDIVGPMDEREQPPIGENHRVVVPERVRPELHIMNARDYNEEEALRQIQSITVDQVLHEIETMKCVRIER